MLHLIESECVMKKFAKLYASLAAIVAASFLYSCEERVETVQEGIPTSLTIRISTPAPAEISTRATDLQETKVSEIALFFYRDGNYLDKPKKVIRLSQSNLVLSDNNPSSTNYIYTANIPEDAGLTSGNYFLYAVANYNSSTFGDVELSKLEKLSLAQLQNFLITKSNEDIQMIEESLLMSGVYGSDGRITLKESGNNNFKDNIHLRRITAKIIFNLTAESGISFQPKTYSVYNCAKKCTLFERSGWTGAKGSFPGSLGSVATADSDFSDKLNVDMSGETGMSFYLLENVQNAKNTAATQKDREKHVSASDQSFLNAPENGTYVVIKGIYNGPISALASDEISSTQVSGEVSYTIHLGDFSNAYLEDPSTAAVGYDNYSIRRNTKYIYNVKVTGVNSIYTEASVSRDQQGYDYGSYDSGAEGTLINLSAGTTNITVDSHFETIMVKMPSGTSAEEYSLKLDTPKGEFIYTQNSNTSAADVSWIKFIKPGSPTSLPSYNRANSTNIFGLLADMRKNGANGGDYYIVDGEYYYTAAFLDEYYYSDLKLAQFVNAPEREMTLATTIAVSPDGKSSYAVTPIFSIRQQSIKSMYNLALEDSDSSFNPFGIEILEEFSAVTWNGTKYVDDSYIDSSSETNGRSNFFEILSDDRQWSTYVNSVHFGHFDNSTLLHSDAMINNYARSQCLSRNRDENGDGIIDDDEIKWYLPALQQTLTIWYGYPSLGNDAKLFIDYQGYFTSTLKKQQRVWYIDEGVSFGMYSGADGWLFGYGGSNSNRTGLLGVRCARTLKNSSEGPTATTEIDPATKVISLKTLGKESVRTSTVTGEYSSHIRNEEPDKLPVAFQVADDYVRDANGNTEFSLSQVQEGSLCHDYYAQDGENVGEGGWRVPNEREFGLMVKHSAEGGYSMTGCMARTKYIRRFDADPITSGYFYRGNLNTDRNEVPNTHMVRCVRDYATTSSAYVD